MGVGDLLVWENDIARNTTEEFIHKRWVSRTHNPQEKYQYNSHFYKPFVKYEFFVFMVKIILSYDCNFKITINEELLSYIQRIPDVMFRLKTVSWKSTMIIHWF